MWSSIKYKIWLIIIVSTVRCSIPHITHTTSNPINPTLNCTTIQDPDPQMVYLCTLLFSSDWDLLCEREIFFVRERLKIFERKVRAASGCWDRSIFCKVTSPKTSEIERRFKFTRPTKNTQDLLISWQTERINLNSSDKVRNEKIGHSS